MKDKSSILIVDDQQTNITVLFQILGQDFTVYIANNGQDAVKTAEKVLPDLILLDILMPDMDGYGVFKLMKNIEKIKDIPKIFITSLNSADEEAKGLAMGAVDYIYKPFSPAIVKLRVNNQIQLLNMRRELEAAAKEANLANRAKSVFLAYMSHEIRTPLNAVMGIAELRLENNTLPLDVKEDFTKIYSSGSLLLGIINDILDMSKIEAGKLELTPVEYDTAEMILSSIHLNKIKFLDKQIEFKLETSENIPSRLYGDDLRIKQILNNLLSNAFKYTEKGQVTLSVGATALGRPDSVQLEFKIRDTGQGMSAGQLAKLFDDYSRFNAESNRVTEGIGLGMGITKNIIGLMEGEIQVESEVGKGTLFIVRLPQKNTGAPPLDKNFANEIENFRTGEPKIQIERRNMQHARVLVVDDVVINIYVAEKMLSPYGLQIDSAADGTEAVQKIKDGLTYDMIFMDNMMPKMDGMEAVRQIRALGYTRPITALTADAVVGMREMFLENGFNDYITKPLNKTALNDLLEKWIPKNQAAINIPGINTELGLSLYDGDSAMFIDFLRFFAENIPAELDKLHDVSQDTLRDYAINAHTVKGSSASIGASALTKEATMMEQMAKAGDLAGVTANNEKFIKDAETLVFCINEWLKE